MADTCTKTKEKKILHGGAVRLKFMAVESTLTKSCSHVLKRLASFMINNSICKPVC